MSRSIPVISLSANCLPEAWEKAVVAVWDRGLEIKTQYDKPADPPSRDATVVIAISEPFREPRIHKNFPGGPTELEAYRQEVVDGIHDHWIDPSAGKWAYTYHQRLFSYLPAGCSTGATDQIRYIVECLARVSHSRRAQAITWAPGADAATNDPPCLQRIWCRLLEESGRLYLHMNAHWRSRDLYRAWFMNVYALTDLQRVVAENISNLLRRPVGVGGYVDISDSLHIYGRYFDQVRLEVEKMRRAPYTERAWSTTHSAFEAMTAEARRTLAEDPDRFARAGQ